MGLMRRLSALVVAVIALTLVATPRPSAQTPATRPGTNHVVFISLDGFMSSALDDPFLPLPTLRRLAAAGVVAKAMRPVNPTVTWANHTAMVTGVTPSRHGVIFNGLLIRKPGVPPVVEPWRDKSEMVRVRYALRRRPTPLGSQPRRWTGSRSGTLRRSRGSFGNGRRSLRLFRRR